MGRFALALLLALHAAASLAAPPLQVLVPRDKSVLREGNLTILGAAPRGTDVRWSIERKSGKEQGQVKADWGDLFEVFVVLEPGVNRVRVGDRTVEVFYAVGQDPVPQGFSSQRVHSGDVSRCDDCHDSLNMRLREGGYPGVCLACHVVVSANSANTKPARDDAAGGVTVEWNGRVIPQPGPRGQVRMLDFWSDGYALVQPPAPKTDAPPPQAEQPAGN